MSFASGCGLAALEFRAKLADRAEALGEYLVIVDRLEVHLACKDEVVLVQ